MLISLDCIGQETVTMLHEAALAEGDICKVGTDQIAKKCLNGEDFFGVVQRQRDNLASVIYRGFVSVPYSGTAPSLGYIGLVADGNGKVKSSDTGRKYQVVGIDRVKQQVCILL